MGNRFWTWLYVAIVIMLISYFALVIYFVAAMAHAQEGNFGEGHEHWHESFYSRLITPKTRVSCCNLADCRPTSGRQIGDHYEVKVSGEWVRVLPDKVVKVSAPDQGFHVCAPRNFSGQPEHLYCVVLPPES
jgi:hypothetical protein